ncbi:MAG: hypothetical protein AAF959_06150 [Cyanobacteria bacterium P01_D01_bin.56]
MNGFHKEDSSVLGFLKNCLFRECLLNKELRKFFEILIEEHDVDKLPVFVFDLVDFDEGPADFAVTLGFSLVSEYSEDERDALYGITYKRGIEPYDCPFTKKQALKKIEQYPHIEQKFRELFPFIEF